MCECNSSVMREVVLDKHVTIEASHLLDSEYADSAEGLSGNGKNFALCNISLKLVVGGGLKSEEGDVTGSNVALESSVGNLYRKSTSHDLLILHLIVAAKLLGAGVAAVEAHECIGELIVELALDGLIVHILGNGVVDVEEGNDIAADDLSDELRETSIDINLTGYRDSHSGKTAVYIAGNELEHGLECRPALSCDGNILSVASVSLNPVKKGKLLLSKLLKDLRLLVSSAELFFHFLNLSRDSLVSGMLVEGLEEVEL